LRKFSVYCNKANCTATILLFGSLQTKFNFRKKTVINNFNSFKTRYMKRIFLLAIAAALTIGTFASDKGKSKGHKSKKAVKTEKVCPPNCPRTGCSKM
jgi:hypothetical protein